jgi:hypothetical protein
MSLLDVSLIEAKIYCLHGLSAKKDIDPRFFLLIESNRELASKLSELETRYERRFRVAFDALYELMPDRDVSRKQIIGLARDLSYA